MLNGEIVDQLLKLKSISDNQPQIQNTQIPPEDNKTKWEKAIGGNGDEPQIWIFPCFISKEQS